jgi:hypothetical protein
MLGGQGSRRRLARGACACHGRAAHPSSGRCLGPNTGCTSSQYGVAEESYTGESRGQHVAARSRRARDALGAQRRRPSLVLFRLSLFEIVKLQKLSTNLKISKNKSCRGAIDLQLSQRASYVLINGLSGNVGRSCSFSRAQVTVKAQSTRFLANLHSKLECPPITKNVFPEITNNFRVGRF